jgi:Gly-Xaa carboxypeptidase
MTLDLVHSHSMVYTLKGTDKILKPLMLTGHLDVVPATTSLDRWTYPPFEGVIEKEWIYGRGTSDCKVSEGLPRPPHLAIR